MKRILFILINCALCILHSAFLQSAPPANYYANLQGKSGDQILATLFAIIGSHTDVGYDGLYSVYPTSDVYPGTNTVWDMYTTCTFTHGQKKCGSYSTVCDCYNREHSVPQSWFGEKSPIKSDAFHVIPTDGKVNGQRGNIPYGECANGSYLTSKATGKVGSSTFPGFSGNVFEPADEYKGDFARTYFYMVACYRNRSFTSSGGNRVFTYSSSITNLTPYAVNLFLKWHRQDPVSTKEINRNEAIYARQHNRNPFIDYPCLAEYVWGKLKGQSIHLAALDSCLCDTITPPKPDTTVIDTGFHVLPVTNIHATSATLNWTTANTPSYTVDVFQTTETGEEEQILYCDTAGTHATKSGYTATGESGATNQIRLGSGSATGALTYTGLDFSSPTRVVVMARYYKNDKSAKLRIAVTSAADTLASATFALTDTLSPLTLSVPAYSSIINQQSSIGQSPITLSISTLVKSERAYIGTVTLITGGLHVDTLHVAGYPQAVGNTLTHVVESLSELEEYTYTVTPQGRKTTDAGTGYFVTEEGWTGTGFVTFPTLDYRTTAQGISLYGIPQPATLTLYDARGRLLDHHAASTEENYNLPSGLYLLRVQTPNQQQVLKLLVR